MSEMQDEPVAGGRQLSAAAFRIDPALVLLQSMRLFARAVAPRVAELAVGGCNGVVRVLVKQEASELRTSSRRMAPVCVAVLCEVEHSDRRTRVSVSLEQKKKGASFGAIATARCEGKEERYLVKMYSGFPSYAGVDSVATLPSFLDTGSADNFGFCSSIPGANVLEPLIYRILQRLDVGPEASFFLAPHTRFGFMTITRLIPR
jgi:hypothetical protein